MSEGLDIASLNLPALPSGWHYKAVSEIGATGEQPVLTGPFGTNLGRSDFVESGVPLLTIGCLTQGGINLDKALFVSEEKAKELSRYRLKEGDLLFSRMASVGRAGLVPKWLEGALFNYHIMRLRLDEARIDTRLFINYVRGAKQVRDYLKAVNHGATRDGINTEQLLGLPVAVPPVAEQREIVAEIEKQFSRLDEAVANLKRVKANLKRYKASILKAAVEGRLVPTEAELARLEGRSYETGEQLLQHILEARRREWNGRGKYEESASVNAAVPGKLPVGWVWATYAQLGEVTTGFTPPTGNAANFGGETPFFKPTDLDAGEDVHVAREYLSDMGLQKGRKLPAGSVLVTCIGATIGKTGLASVDCATNQQINAVSPAVVGIDCRYLFWWTTSPHGQRQIVDNASATTLPILNKSKFEALPVALPPAAEQHRIVAEVDRCLSIVREVEAEVDTNLKRAQALRSSVLQRAFSVSA